MMNLSNQIFIPRIRNYLILLRNNSTQSNAEYCMNLVRSYDYENFISILLLKEGARSCAFAVRSFNVEIARVAEQVSKEDIGLMRLQFWEDAVEKCFLNDIKMVPRHPVAVELYKAVNKHKLSKLNLKKIISSRKEHLHLNGFNTLEDIEKYSEKSVSSLYYLILEGCGVKDLNADHAASHLGKAQGIVQQLRSIPQCRRLNFIPVPQETLVKNNVSQEDLLRSKSSKALSDCVYEIASRAHQHVMKARSLQEKVPSDGRRAFLPAVAVLSYLNRLQSVDYDVFHPKLKHRQWSLLLQMWFSNFKNNY